MGQTCACMKRPKLLGCFVQGEMACPLVDNMGCTKEEYVWTCACEWTMQIHVYTMLMYTNCINVTVLAM
jgi:hypothetical protein